MNLRIAKKLCRAGLTAEGGAWIHRRAIQRWARASRIAAQAIGRGCPRFPQVLRERTAGDYFVDYGAGPQRARNLGEWAYWFECFPLRQVAVTRTHGHEVSTVCLGLGLLLTGDVYESARWPVGPDGERLGPIKIMARYADRAAALRGHRELVESVISAAPAVALSDEDEDEDEDPN